MKKLLTTILCALALPAFGQTIYTDLEDARLKSALYGNGQDIENVAHLTLGAGSPTARIHLLPSGTPTTAADGIKIGNDISLYRSANGTLTLGGNLIVTGLINGSSGGVDTSINYTWSGNHTFNGTTTMGNNGISFSGTGAANTRSALALVPGVNVQTYSALLLAIAGQSPASNSILIGTGTSWQAVTGASARAALGLGSGDAVTVGSLTVIGATQTAATNVTGVLTLANATSSGAAIKIGGDTTLYRSAADVLKTDDTFNAAGGAIFGDGNDTVAVLGTLLFGPDLTTGNWDVNLYRAQADRLKTDDSFEIGGSLILSSALGLGSGGTGLNLSSIPADRFLYSSNTGVLAQGTITTFGRSMIDDADAAAVRTTLGLGLAAVKDAPSSGNASGGQVVLATDTRLTDGRVPSGSAGGVLTGTYPNPTGLAGTGVTGGTYGSSSLIPIIQVAADGRITSVSNTAPAGAPPTGTASGALTGSYPAPVIAADAVALGNNTTGNYVASVAVGSSLSLVNGGGSEGATLTLNTAQPLTTASSPTFADLTVTGTLSFASLNPTELSLSGGKLTGIYSTKIIKVDSTASGATDTRTGISAYDVNRPFATLAAALTASTSGDTIALAPGTYASLTPPKDLNFYLEKGAVITAFTLSGSYAVEVYGFGEIRNSGGYGVTVNASSAGLTLRVPSYGTSGGLLLNSGTVNAYALLGATTNNTNAASLGGSATLNLYQGASLICSSVSTDFVTLAGSGTVNIYGNIPMSGTISGTVTKSVQSGSVVTRNRVVASTATFGDARDSGSGLLVGSVPIWNSLASTILHVDGDLEATSLDLATALPITEGGTGATTASGARTNLGIPTMPASGVRNFIVGAADGSTFESHSYQDVQGYLGLSSTVATSASTVTISATTGVQQASSTSSSITLTLPAASGAAEGQVLVIRQSGNLTGTNFTTIAPNGGDSLTGPTKLFRQYDTIVVKRTSSSAWVVVSSYNSGEISESLSFTTSIGDNTTMVSSTNTSSTITLTLPSPANFSGNTMVIRQTGALTGGNYTRIQAASSTNLNGVSTGTYDILAGQAVLTLKKISSTDWAVVSYISASGGVTYTVNSYDTTGSIAAGSDVVLAYRPYGDTYTLTLPAAGSFALGKSLIIKRTGTSIPTIEANGSDSIDGSSGGSFTMDQPLQAIMLTRSASASWSLTGVFKDGGVLQEASGDVTVGGKTDILTQSSSGNSTITLPSAASIPVGKRYVIKVTGDISSGGGVAAVTANGSDTLDGVSGGNYKLVNKNDAVTVQKTGSTDWVIVDAFSPRKKTVTYGSTASVDSNAEIVLSSYGSTTPQTLTLPALSSQPVGKQIFFKQTGDQDVASGSYVAVAANGSDNLDGVSGGTVRLTTQYDSFVLENSGSGWMVVTRWQAQPGYRYANNADISLNKWEPFVVSNPTTSSRTMTLPAVSTAGIGKGFRFQITHTGANVLYPTIIATTSGNTINDGEYASGVIKLIYPGETLILVSDAANSTWRVESWSRAPLKLVTFTGSINLGSSLSAVTYMPDVVIYNNSSSATLNLPVAAAMIGRKMTVRSIAAGAVVLDPDGATLIDGATTKNMTAGTSLSVVFDGTNWYTVAGP